LGGYAKIDKNKIQPSPALAAITGLLTGLNAHKKEMQDKEDKQNKADMELGKWMKEFGLKERETQVKEQGVDIDRERVQIDYSKLEQANAELITKAKAVGNDIDKLNFEISKYKNEPKRQAEIADLKFRYDKLSEEYKGYVDTQTYLKKKQIEFGDAGIAGYEGLSYAEIAQQISDTSASILEGQRQKGRKEVVGIQQAGENVRLEKSLSSRENIAIMDAEEAYKRAMIEKSPEGKTPEVKVYMDFSQGYLDEIAKTRAQYTEKGKTTSDIPADEMRRLDILYNQTRVAHEALPEDVKDRLLMPEKFVKTSDKKGWGLWKQPPTYGYEGGATAQPTKPLSSGELKDITKLTTPAMIQQAKSFYKSEDAAYKSLIKAGYSNTVALKVLDKLYPKGK